MIEKDPNGKENKESGAKLDHGKVRMDLVLSGFARALNEVGKVGTFGAAKYSDNGWKDVSDGINRYSDAMLRHYIKSSRGEFNDSESGVLHDAHLAWNALARLDLKLREREKINLSYCAVCGHDYCICKEES